MSAVRSHHHSPTGFGVNGLPHRIGLLTLPLYTNYGGILQAAALYQILTAEMGKDVVFLERTSSMASATPMHRATVQTLERLPFLPALRDRLHARAKRTGPLAGLARKLLPKAELALRARKSRTHEPFLDKVLPHRSGKLVSTADMAAAVERHGIATLVVGSDQVWRLDYLPGSAQADFFFGFAPSPTVRKVAYAASFGHSDWIYPEHTDSTRELLSRFDAVSVRERSGVDICARVLGRADAVQVIDPTLLVDPAFYERIAAPAGRRTGKTFLSYVLDEGPDRVAFGQAVQAALDPDYAHRPLTLVSGSATLDVPAWLRAFMDADFVVTDSFHGMVFSVLFRKNFVALVNSSRGADRFTSLMHGLGLEDRLVFDADPERARQLVRTPVDFERVAPRLQALRASSGEFLRQALG